MEFNASIDKGLKKFLDKKVDEYNQPAFIVNDPISIPHRFHKKQDIEIAGFFAAIFSWGNRTTIINKSKELLHLMDNAPYQFCRQHESADLKKLLEFKHRTFNTTDLLYFISFLKHHYTSNRSLESAFFNSTIEQSNQVVENGLNHFYNYFFSLADAPKRTYKHIASPQKNSSCKRLNMYLRWMIRKDDNGVDFGLWKSISPAALICPVDVHVARVAKHFKLLERRQVDWQAALELTNNLRKLDSHDPAKYDFALFGLGVIEKF
ncbi:MAG: TIGR02757 family protein [Chitinophagaceae bacterium]|nr:TIGR02757 family protein [Chitinophagaceae bacterium]